MFTSLVQGQEDLKKLINKKKRVVGVLNMGRRHKGGPKVVSRIELSDRSAKAEGSVKGHEEDQREPENKAEGYESEQYSFEDDKYKQLEDRLNAMENLKMSGLNFDDLSLVLGVVIPRKFKVPTFCQV